MKNPYEILGFGRIPEGEIPPTPELIKAAHRRLCKQHHPDKGGDPEKFKDVQWAYEVLTDPEKLSAWKRGEDPSKIEQAHVAVVVKVVMELVPRMDLKTGNLIDAARQTIGRMKDSTIDRVGDLIIEAERLRGAAGRVSALSNENLIAGILNSTADKMEAEAKLGDAEVDKLCKALAFLDDYAYKTDEERLGTVTFSIGKDWAKLL